MKTFKNGFARIEEVAEVLTEAALGTTRAQARLDDVARHEAKSEAERSGERLVRIAYRRYGLNRLRKYQLPAALLLS